MLSENAKAKRLARCHLLLCSLQNKTVGHFRFFSDDKIFTVVSEDNRRNDRWFIHGPEDVPIVAKTKFLANVLLVVSSESDIMPWHFFQKEKNVIKKSLCKGFTNCREAPWINIVASGRSFSKMETRACQPFSAELALW